MTYTRAGSRTVTTLPLPARACPHMRMPRAPPLTLTHTPAHPVRPGAGGAVAHKARPLCQPRGGRSLHQRQRSLAGRSLAGRAGCRVGVLPRGARAQSALGARRASSRWLVQPKTASWFVQRALVTTYEVVHYGSLRSEHLQSSHWPRQEGGKGAITRPKRLSQEASCAWRVVGTW